MRLGTNTGGAVMWSLVQTIEPLSEPIEREDAKLQARIDSDITDEDALIDAYIMAARQLLEQETGRQLIEATYDLRLSAFPSGDCIQLPRPPLRAVLEVVYRDSNGVQQTWAPSNYRVDTAHDPGRLWRAYNVSWPATRTEFDAVLITYTAGYGLTPNAVPQPLRQAIQLLVAEFYAHREATEQRAHHTLPLSVDRLLWPYRTAEVLIA